MRKDTELELMSELRGYFIHYPYGHTVVDCPDEWRSANMVWLKIQKLSTQLEDSGKTLNKYTQELKEEGLDKRHERKKSQVNA